MKQIIKIPLLVLTALSAVAGNGQSATTLPADSLYNEVRRADSIMFTAFNSRNLGVFEKMFTADLEFFHDKGGLTTYDHTIGFLKNLIRENSDLKRELVSGSLEVYPVPGYGAIETGRHSFTHTENGKTETAIFKFVHVWQYKDNEWRVSRVISYGH